MAANKNILVVDDDKIILDSLTEFLTQEGFQTTGTKTLKEAVSILHEQSFSLVITEVTLPDGNCFELLNDMCENHRQTVAIIITAYGTIE